MAHVTGIHIPTGNTVTVLESYGAILYVGDKPYQEKVHKVREIVEGEKREFECPIGDVRITAINEIPTTSL